MSTGYILGVSRGHNSGVCLLHNGKVVFSIEEERLSRKKYDGSPLAAMSLVKNYTDKVDAIVTVHTASLESTAPKIEYTGDDLYGGYARKIGLIDQQFQGERHHQVLDYSHLHHKLHAACAFYRSGFDEAVAVVIDGAGSAFHLSIDQDVRLFWEVESIIDCSYPSFFKTLYKHYAGKEVTLGGLTTLTSEKLDEPNSTHEALISDCCGITKTYEAVTLYCGFQAIDAGKTMGLFPYGKHNEAIPPFFYTHDGVTLSSRNLFVPNYPNGALVNQGFYKTLSDNNPDIELSKQQNRRDMAYAVQKQSQEQALKVILKAVEMSGKKNVVLSGGYGLNCVANYFFLQKLNELGINLYVEPISNDGGTAMGAALYHWYSSSASMDKQPSDIYLGPKYDYKEEYIEQLVAFHGGEIKDSNHKEVVSLLREKNIVCVFQGRSENGPRALGNRSILFDPTFEDGKDYVNSIKKREYFRPFAGSVLQDHAHEWFDLRGMESSPHMMYAVNVKQEKEKLIPSIIHIDGTCRIQTVSRDDNPLYYELIETFYKETGVPILFNTSFNLGGDPLVETLEDAINTLKKSSLEYLYLPEYGKLIHIKNV